MKSLKQQKASLPGGVVQVAFNKFPQCLEWGRGGGGGEEYSDAMVFVFPPSYINKAYKIFSLLILER